MEAIKLFTDNPIVQLFVIVLAVVSLIAAFVFYYRSKRERVPCFARDSMTIRMDFASALPGLQVAYNGVPYDSVTFSRIYFWNAGRETIRRSDLTASSPLAIELDAGTTVLSASVQRVSDTSSCFKIGDIFATAEGLTAVGFEFDYLECDQGGAIQIIHTGSETAEAKVIGKVIGARSIKEVFLADVGTVKYDLIRRMTRNLVASFALMACLSSLGIILHNQYGAKLASALVSEMSALGLVQIVALPSTPSESTGASIIPIFLTLLFIAAIIGIATVIVLVKGGGIPRSLQK